MKKINKITTDYLFLQKIQLVLEIFNLKINVINRRKKWLQKDI